MPAILALTSTKLRVATTTTTTTITSIVRAAINILSTVFGLFYISVTICTITTAIIITITTTVVIVVAIIIVG